MSLPTVFEGWSAKMAVADYESGQWGEAHVILQETQRIHPGAMALQFGASVFEGCKAYRATEDHANVFRLVENHARLMDSCARLCIPSPSYEMYAEAIRLVVSQTVSWKSPFESDWLYIRPVLIALDDHIMPVVSSRYTFYLLTAPIRSFQAPSFNLWIEPQYSRAAPGGLGAAKTGANYAHQLYPTMQAKRNGYDAVVWLDPFTHSTIEEASTMNIFFCVGNEIITPELKDTILAGITRRSVISLLQKEGWKVSERAVTVSEILDWIQSGTLDEAFATSTALGVRTIDTLSFKGEQFSSSRNAAISMRLSQTLQDIYQGKVAQFREWTAPITMTRE